MSLLLDVSSYYHIRFLTLLFTQKVGWDEEKLVCLHSNVDGQFCVFFSSPESGAGRRKVGMSTPVMLTATLGPPVSTGCVCVCVCVVSVVTVFFFLRSS